MWNFLSPLFPSALSNYTYPLENDNFVSSISQFLSERWFGELKFLVQKKVVQAKCSSNSVLVSSKLNRTAVPAKANLRQPTFTFTDPWDKVWVLYQFLEISLGKLILVENESIKIAQPKLGFYFWFERFRNSTLIMTYFRPKPPLKLKIHPYTRLCHSNFYADFFETLI